jgi:membrane protein YdbS with pleckstrin-like domain
MNSNTQQRIIGAVLVLLSTAAMGWLWYQVVKQAQYYSTLAAVVPIFLVIGLGQLVFGGYREERVARGEDVSKLSSVEMITPRWWVVLALAIIAGLANFYLLSIYPF